jgi:hypothetical protein
VQEFEKAAASHSGRSIVSELIYFLRESRKWWLAPVLVLFVIFAVFMLMAGSAAAPFIYTIF